MNRICTTCKESKELTTEFYITNKHWYRRDCKECFKRVMRPRSANHYQKNKKSYYARKRAYAKIGLKFIQDYKANKPCTDCHKIYHPFCLDFDHLYGKVRNISLVPRLGWSIEHIKKEIAKCELVCATCHRLRTLARLEKTKLASLT